MPLVDNAVLFSSYFGISPEVLAKAGLIDPFLRFDVPLFIDPVLLEKSTNITISQSAHKRFCEHFEILVRMLAISEKENDAAWKAAQKQVSLQEPPQNGLGYGRGRRSGSSRPDHIREQILRTSKEIISLGVKDPEMISLMGFFEEKVGADTISDLTTTVILKDLIAITQEFCKINQIPVSKCASSIDELPLFKDHRKLAKPIVLVPCDIVRELPIANDWSDIERAAMENSKIRDRVSALLGGIARPTIADRKSALRDAALNDAVDFDFFLAAVKENVTSYDPDEDPLGYYKAKELISNKIFDLKQDSPYNLQNGSAEIFRLVKEIISAFKRHVENGNLWEELWVQDKPKKERASQLIFYAIADAYCKANNVDISPEANMGGGPIDFKFSRGYKARVLVEMKRSSGTVVHGYKRQLEFYKEASQTDYAIFVIIDYGDLGNKLSEIKISQQKKLANGERAADIVVIDATKKESASKRH